MIDFQREASGVSASPCPPHEFGVSHIRDSARNRQKQRWPEVQDLYIVIG